MTHETDDLIRGETDKNAKIACIGPTTSIKMKEGSRNKKILRFSIFGDFFTPKVEMDWMAKKPGLPQEKSQLLLKIV